MTENIFQKQSLRTEYKAIRNRVKNKDEKSEIVFKKLCEDEDFLNAKTVAFFKSFGTEIDTSEMIKNSILLGKNILLPKVNGREMEFYKYTTDTPLEKSRFGVEEPIGNETALVSADGIDLVIVPGLCFDKCKNRLGYGGGFYDKLLGKNDIKNIAVCFDEQIADDFVLPVDENDVKVKKIITDKRIIK